MANVDLLTAVGVATFGGGIFFGIILVVAAGIRAEGHLAWRRGAVTLRDDPASRLAQGIRRINGVGIRVLDIDGRPSVQVDQAEAEPRLSGEVVPRL
ncbi:MAG TPA: hypothetical protein VIZ20_16060 [Streptosporangiaceae bacterium]